MSYLRMVKYGLTSILIVSLMSVLFLKSRVNSDGHEALLFSFSSLHQLDAQVNDQVVRFRFGLTEHYDDISASVLRLRTAANTMRSQILSTYTGGAEVILDKVEVVYKRIDKKIHYVEKIKQVNAVQRLSARFLPESLRRLTFAAHADASVDEHQRNSFLNRAALLNQEIAYVLSGQVTTDEGMLRYLKVLSRIAQNFEGDLRTKTDTFLGTASAIINERILVDDLAKSFEAMESDEAVSVVEMEYAKFRSTLVQDANSYRFVLYVISILLMAYVVVMFRRLRRASDELKSTLDHLQVLARFPEENKDAIVRISADGTILFANMAAADLLTYWQVGIGGLVPPHVRIAVGEVLQCGHSNEDDVIVGERIIEIELLPVVESGYVNLYGRDVTERKHAQEQLAQEKELALVTLHSIGDAVITTSDFGLVQYMNPVAEQMTGWEEEDAVGLHLNEVFVVTQESGKPASIFGESGEDILSRQEQVWVLFDRSGREHSIEHSVSPIMNDSDQQIGSVLVFHDVSEARKLQKQVEFQASHDGLTGLVNRDEFKRELEAAVRSSQGNDREHALLYLDLDQFKIVNDTCGHVAGDELLRQLGGLLQLNIRTSDVLARLGGDEFGVLLKDCTIDKARHLAVKLLETVNEFRFVWEESTFDVGVSIGVISVNGQVADQAELMSGADVACYAAKEQGRNRINIYKPDDEEVICRQDEMHWVAEIKKALAEDRMRVFGQSIVPVDPTSGKHPHYEVLIRMIGQDGKLIPPGAFIPAAERFNLMPEIDRWVIATVFSMYARAASEDPDFDQHFAINLSGATLTNDDIRHYIGEQLEKYRVPPEAISFEVTETAAISNLANAVRVIKAVKAVGCQFSLDDFGSGLSSFAYLKNLPVDYLKIDGCFVKDMVTDPIDRAMVESINRIGHVMGIETIAEFVEDELILAELEKIGVDYAQGYGIQKPTPLEELLWGKQEDIKTA